MRARSSTRELWSGAAAALCALATTGVVVAVFTNRPGDPLLLFLVLLLLLALPGVLVGIGAYAHAAQHAPWGRTVLGLGSSVLGLGVGGATAFLLSAFGTGFLQVSAVFRAYPSRASFLLNTWYLWLWLAAGITCALAVYAAAAARAPGR